MRTMTASDAGTAGRVEAVRRFNRFYTQRIGVLDEGLLRMPFSLTEARVVYEMAQREPATATALGQALGLDAGYLSRIVRSFEERGVVERTPSPTDGRQWLLSLTGEGRRAFARLDAETRRQIGAMLEALSGDEQRRLVEAFAQIETLLGERARDRAPYLLRPHQSGDMGWVVQRHGVLYSQEYGWDERFEALVARIAADFIDHFDPKRERCWIAEKDGENVGSVFLVKHPEDPEAAKLRLLLVEPRARGLGIGARLVGECTRFARRAGYRRITLWTNSVLVAARRLYEREGYRLVREEPHHSFGHDLVGQTWELEL
jgi:DNA-binding MarR family transcriptional regulator/GNAT superfamily N-acetyltransferase